MGLRIQIQTFHSALSTPQHFARKVLRYGWWLFENLAWQRIRFHLSEYGCQGFCRQPQCQMHGRAEMAR